MHQRTLVTNTEDIRSIAREINIFSCKRQIFKVQLNQYSEAENFAIEKKLVKLYSLGQHRIWAILPVYTIMLYLLMVLLNIIPYGELGIVATILLYAPFAFGSILFLKVITAWYAKRSLTRMANELNAAPSFVFG